MRRCRSGSSRRCRPRSRRLRLWPAEEHHQDYYEKSSLSYRFYRTSCGRDHRLEEIWGQSGE